MKDLDVLREQIDRVDKEILRLFKERMGISLKIAEYKKQNKIPVFDPSREKQKLSPVNDPYVKKLYMALFEISKEYQRRILGETGLKRILVINGPNLNMLGVREPELYGDKTYADLLEFIQTVCTEADVDCECIQSNHEGKIVDAIQNARGRFDGIIINPAAFTHTSVAILDALKAVNIPAVEVHLTDIKKREDFRKISYTGLACEKTFKGMGFKGYAEAVRYLLED